MRQVSAKKKKIIRLKITHVIANETTSFAFFKKYEFVFLMLMPGHFKIGCTKGEATKEWSSCEREFLNNRFHANYLNRLRRTKFTNFIKIVYLFDNKVEAILIQSPCAIRFLN